MKKILCLLLSTAFLACTASKDISSSAGNSLKTGTETPGKLEFKAESPRYKADGSFAKWHFTKIEIPQMKKKDLTGMTATLEVETGSVQEKAEGLVNHLKQNDFLDVAQYPNATVEIKEVTKVEGTSYKAKALLKIKTFSAEYPLNFELTDTKNWHVKGELTILRNAFGLGDPEGGIKNEVKVMFDTDLK